MEAHDGADQDTTRRFAADLRSIREAAGLSVRELGDEAKLSKSAVSAAEQGRKPPTDTVLGAYLRGAGLEDLEIAQWHNRLKALRRQPGGAGGQDLGNTTAPRASITSIPPGLAAADGAVVWRVAPESGAEPAEDTPTPDNHRMARDSGLAGADQQHKVVASESAVTAAGETGPVADPSQLPAGNDMITGNSGGDPDDVVSGDHEAGTPEDAHHRSAGQFQDRRHRFGGRGTIVAAAVILLIGAALAWVITAGARNSVGPDGAATSTLSDGAATSTLSAPPATSAPVQAQTAADLALRDVTFAFPKDGEAVTSPLVPKGTAALAANHALWLLLRPLDKDPKIYYVTTDSEIAIDSSGNWDSDLHLGEGKCDEDNHYELFAVSAPRGGVIEQRIPRRPPGQYSVRLPDIPSDAEVLARIEIKLGHYQGNRTCK